MLKELDSSLHAVDTWRVLPQRNINPTERANNAKIMIAEADQTKVAIINQAIGLLESAGISGTHICHPTLREYEPYIPLCSDNACNDERHLEDGGKNVREDDDYFDVPDDEDVYSIAEDYFAGADEEDPYYYLIRNGVLAFICVFVAAVEAGLLMGVMSLDPTILEVKGRTAKSPVERKQARTLLAFVRRKNLIMTSIIIINMAVNEALPVFLDRLVPTYLSVLLSTTLVVFVGEVSSSLTKAFYLRVVGPKRPRVSIIYRPLISLCIFLPLMHPCEDFTLGLFYRERSTKCGVSSSARAACNYPRNTLYFISSEPAS